MAADTPIKDDEDAVRTVNARQRLRSQLEDDVAAFLGSGGSIQEVGVDVTADPPAKPVSKYGGRPI